MYLICTHNSKCFNTDTLPSVIQVVFITVLTLIPNHIPSCVSLIVADRTNIKLELSALHPDTKFTFSVTSAENTKTAAC